MSNDNKDNGLITNHYATIDGVQGQQFGRDIYTAVLKFKDLEKFLKVFPEVQRNASGRKINKIKSYILSGLSEKNLRFFSSLTVTTRGNVFYDGTEKRIAIDTSGSKLSINDGQHRFYGICEAIKDLEIKIKNGRNEEKRTTYAEQLYILKEMSVPLVIFNQIDEIAEKQLFYDLNNLSSKPSKSVNIRLSQNDIFSILSRKVVEDSKFLDLYGVEVNKQSIHKNNPNTVLLTTVHAMCKALFSDDYREDNKFADGDKFNEIAAYAVCVFDSIFNALPKDLKIKGKYIIEKSYCLRGVAIFVREHMSDKNYEDIINNAVFKGIGEVDWTHNIDYWSKFATVEESGGLLQFPGSGEGGIMAVRRACAYEFHQLTK